LGEAVDHVGLKGREDAHEAETEGDEGDDGDDPVDFVVGCPAVPGVVSGVYLCGIREGLPEERDRDQAPEEHAER